MKIIVFLIITILSLNAQSIKNKNFGSTRISEVISIYDGDTFRANIKDYPDIIGYHISIRINGIDTPELRGKCIKEKQLARKAKQTTVQLLRTAKIIKLHNMKRGKYFRIIADIEIDGKSLGKILLDKKLAVPYNGGTKINWCK
jgi:endonuclease YncB( thermonuclease family)